MLASSSIIATIFCRFGIKVSLASSKLRWVGGCSLADLLNAHGFATLAFASAEEFLARGTEHVDCLLLDIDLGGMSGIELRRQLKGFCSTLPIIFMTALDDEAIAFLRKPFSSRALVDAIGKAVA